MVITTISSFTTSVPTDDTIPKLNKALHTLPSHPRFTLGTKVQDPTTIQITAEWPSAQAPSDLTTTSAYQDFANTIESIASSPPSITLAYLNGSIFSSGNPPLIEFVASSFPSSSTSSPELKTRIEADFARFETIYRRRGRPEACGEIGLASGWAEEKDGVNAFVVVRGWSGMGRFEESLQTEEFKEGIPILMGWEVPFELWHVERRAGGEGL